MSCTSAWVTLHTGEGHNKLFMASNILCLRSLKDPLELLPHARGKHVKVKVKYASKVQICINVSGSLIACHSAWALSPWSVPEQWCPCEDSGSNSHFMLPPCFSCMRWQAPPLCISTEQTWRWEHVVCLAQLSLMFVCHLFWYLFNFSLRNGSVRKLASI